MIANKLPIIDINKNPTIFQIQKNTHYSKVMVFLLYFYAIFIISPIWPTIGIRGSHWVLLFLFCTAFVSIIYNNLIKIWFIWTTIFTFLLALIPAIYWEEPRLILVPASFFTAYFLLSQSTLQELSRFVDLASNTLFIVLIGAVAGFGLAQIGMSPLFEFIMPDGRPTFFFGTTLANKYVGNFIRPSGFYDEPGTLSFIICSVAFMRHSLGKNNQLTWILLILGFLTFSLAHLIFVIVFLLSNLTNINIKKIIIFMLCIIVFFGLISFTILGNIFEEKLFSRLEIKEETRLAGDNRSDLMWTALDIIMEKDYVVFVGADSYCIFNAEECIDKYGNYAVNPLAPLVSVGIFIAWPYYLFLVMALVYILRDHKNLAFFAIALVFLQRPYILQIGYSLLGVIALWLQINKPFIILQSNKE